MILSCRSDILEYIFISWRLNFGLDYEKETRLSTTTGTGTGIGTKK